MGEKVRLTRTQDGGYAESTGEDSEVYWTRTSYTEPRECLDTCTVCGQDIEEWELFVCLDDGSESAHVGCVEITTGGAP